MRQRLRVAVVARSVYPLHGYGGLERHVHDLVTHLARAGVEVTLVVRQGAGGAADRPSFLESGVRLLTVPYRTFPYAGRKGTTILDRSTAYPLFGERAGKTAWHLVRQGAIDIVHGLGASVLGYARRRRTGSAPLVMNPQGLEEFGATDPSRARLKRAAYLPLRRAVLACARAADCVIATDRSLEPAVLHHLRVSREKVRLVPNAIDLQLIDAPPRADPRELRAMAQIAPEDEVLLSVGRLEANKGFGVLAEALAALAAHGTSLPDCWKWVLIGDGPDRTAIARAVSRLGLRGRVRMLGRVPDGQLHAWYETAALFVHPTLYEGSSLVTLEAMAHRKAIVATTAGGLPDKVRPGANGWLVAPGDAALLASAISGALAQPERLRAMGEESRTIVERAFAWPAVTRTLLGVYGDLLRSRN